MSRLAMTSTAIGCTLLAFDDIRPLRALGGGVAASPAWAALLLAALLLLRGAGLVRRRLLLGASVGLLLYACVLTTATTPLGAPQVFGVSPVAKGLLLCGTIAIWISTVLAGWVLLRRAREAMLVGAIVALGIMVIGAIIYRFDVIGPDQWQLLHSEVNAQQRVRSTRFEASSLGAGMLAVTGIAVLSAPSRRTRSVIGLVGVACTAALTQSRGTTLIAVGGLVILGVLQILPRRSWTTPSPVVIRVVTVVLAVAAAGVALGLPLLVESPLWTQLGLSDASRGTSDATRAGWADVAVQVLTVAPAGLGLGNFLALTPALLSSAIHRLSGAYSVEALAELRRSATGVSTSGVSPKTLPTLGAFYLGWVGLGAVVLTYATAIRGGLGAMRAGRDPAPFVLATCVIAASAGYYSSVFSWDQALFFGAALAAFDGGRPRPTSASGPTAGGEGTG